MKMRYLVTTRQADIPDDHQILMVDGTVPGWVQKEGDCHWDHHRVGGAPIQLDEMPPLPREGTLAQSLADGRPQCIVTTLLDADACAAAAWLQLSAADLGARQADVLFRLRTIAFECDHLGVPPEMTELAHFAASAVATLKIGYKSRLAETDSEPARRAALAAEFERCTSLLLAAARGEEPWPGERGEAEQYWLELEEQKQLLASRARVSFLAGSVIADCRGVDRYIDPRAANAVAQSLRREHKALLRTVTHRVTRVRQSMVLTVRDKFPEATPGQRGIAYTLGSDPAEPGRCELDYSRAGVWEALTRQEAVRRGVDPAIVDAAWGESDIGEQLGFDPWGGRAAVGGSGWNTASALLPHDVLDLAGRCIDQWVDGLGERT